MKERDIKTVECIVRCPYLTLNWRKFSAICSRPAEEVTGYLNTVCALENCHMCREIPETFTLPPEKNPVVNVLAVNNETAVNDETNKEGISNEDN